MACPDDECARCHVAYADAVNMPCGHRLLCMSCALAVREAAGCVGADEPGICNLCRAPSTLVVRTPDPNLDCAACGESWPPRSMFVPGTCGHALCVGCTTQVARDAHGDRTRVTASGLRCGFSGCATRLSRDVVRMLHVVGSRTLPDPRAQHGDPPAVILPLSMAEVPTGPNNNFASLCNLDYFTRR